MVCPGIVTNVTNFGAFVDIGVHQDGLVHISQLADRFVKDPREVVSPGDRVTVRVARGEPRQEPDRAHDEERRRRGPSAGEAGAAEAAGKSGLEGGEAARPTQLSSGALKNDALKKLEQFRASGEARAMRLIARLRSIAATRSR